MLAGSQVGSTVDAILRNSFCCSAALRKSRKFLYDMGGRVPGFADGRDYNWPKTSVNILRSNCWFFRLLIKCWVLVIKSDANWKYIVTAVLARYLT